MLIVFYLFTTILLAIYSWGFVDIHSPFPMIKPLYDFVHLQRGWATTAYSIFFVVLFLLYIRTLSLVKKGELSFKTLMIIIAACIMVLILGFPGLSYDVFNYMATARVA